MMEAVLTEEGRLVAEAISAAERLGRTVLGLVGCVEVMLIWQGQFVFDPNISPWKR
jgi:hypothetical protein